MNYLTRLLLILVLAVALLAPTSDMAEFQEGDYRYTVDNDEATVTKYEGPGGDVTIPATLGEHPVRIIGSQAFSDNTTINSVVIPDSVTTIADLFMFEGAFSGCTSLESVTLGDSVETIGNAAFSGCAALASLTIPASVTSIGSSAFAECASLESVLFYGEAPTEGMDICEYSHPRRQLRSRGDGRMG